MKDEEKEFPRGQLNPAILHTLLDRDKYGYEIIQEIKNKTGIEIKQPSLYSSLKRMETQKLISSYWQDSDIGGKRHYYCLTGIGKQFLEKNPVDFSSFEAKDSSIAIENRIKEKVQEIDEKIQSEIKVFSPQTEQLDNKVESEQPKLAEQDNIFNVLKNLPQADNKTENKEEIEEENKNFIQYDLFQNIKSTEGIKLEEEKNIEILSKRVPHSRNSSDPYQLKHLSEDELKSEFEKIRNQKLGSPAEPVKSNVWLDRNSYMESEKPKENFIEKKPKEENYIIEQEKIEKKADDAVFITERIEFDNIPKSKIEPVNLNIESNNYSTFLNSKTSSRDYIREDKEAKEKYQQKIAQMFSKKPDDLKYNYNKSLNNLEDKFEKHISGKNQTKEYSEPKEDFNKVDNTYERVKNHSPMFNSYKSLESYYNSKGIGFYIYNKKEKNAKQYVDYSLIKLTRGIIFSLYSIILSFAFYFGIKAESIGKASYIILPILILGLTIFYAVSYHKSKSNTIINIEEKASVAPVILPLISACAILVIIAINLIMGFHDGNALYYFPLLIYPICLALHIACIIPLNKLIKFSILKYRSVLKNRKK